jgi:hypothetical protein
VVDEENLAVVNDEDCDGEIYFFVGVGHVAGKNLTRKTPRRERRIFHTTGGRWTQFNDHAAA